ncbi:hypothetical protein B7494_g3885 [Chlorociboria aeruginascens]|nr:hypothetical protein B7494_g3885 [Chlorociboria aeruginascens]
MVASADDQKLLLGVLTQAKVGKIDYDQLSRYLETTKGAAQVRWSRFNSKLRNPRNSMTADDNKLALGVISQADMGKINYEQLGNFLGTTKGAAQVRWSRFKSKLRQSSGTSLTQPAGVKKTKSPAKASVQAKRKRKEEAITIPAIPPGNLSSRKVRGQALKQESDKGESEGEDV